MVQLFLSTESESSPPVALCCITPESYLKERGYKILRNPLNLLDPSYKALVDLRSSSQRVMEQRKPHPEDSDCRNLNGENMNYFSTLFTPLEAVGIGARDIMCKASLIDPSDTLFADKPITPPPYYLACAERMGVDAGSYVALNPRPNVQSFPTGDIRFGLSSPKGKLVLVHTARWDDDNLRVKKVDYAIALASTDPDDGLPTGDVDAAHIEALARNLGRVLGSEYDATWYATYNGKKESIGLPVK
ncbi:hypothetical protein EW026_g1614 [Hermanssonia centrifuga]|uniref:Uncharacterized protein n=1 Tax=Hermanssonia centrifuga TaxID=98765 RepID=A0A4S4KRF8_9APHY|nr:hypothetical protein EW026_g1614 [Hermanssonia centrifuga]